MLSASFLSLAILAQSASAQWGGASLQGTMQSVSGTFLVPQVSPPTIWTAGTQYRASTWVGIDGFSFTPNGPKCPHMLQSGVSMRVTPSASGALSYACCPWYEWLPANEIFFDSSCNWCQPGDSINVTVIASSTTTGNVTMTNNNSGQTFVKSFSSPNAPLCLEFADWVVEQGRGTSPRSTQSRSPRRRPS